MKHFITIADTTTENLTKALELARALRQERREGKTNKAYLAGKTLAMIFEKPSLRTRVSFEQATYELGGRAIVLTNEEVGLGKREKVADVARVLSGMVHGVMARVFDHQKLLDLAAYGSVPVINALSDYSHPCQALGDALTISDEFGTNLTGRRIAFVGDGNNVARSLAMLCGKFGMHFALACPDKYNLEREYLERVRAMTPGVDLLVTRDPVEAVAKADVVYTDTWVSMGQEAEKEARRQVFRPYQVNGELLSRAPRHAIVMHCLPAYRGSEITDEMMDGPRSRVFPQAHNRLHIQKAILAMLMGS